MQGYGITLGAENVVNALFLTSDCLLNSCSRHPKSSQNPPSVRSRTVFKNEFGQLSLYSQSQCSDTPSMWIHLQWSLCLMAYSPQGRLVGRDGAFSMFHHFPADCKDQILQ